MPRKKTPKQEEPEEQTELDPEVELFLDHLAKIIVRIRTDEANGFPFSRGNGVGATSSG